MEFTFEIKYESTCEQEFLIEKFLFETNDKETQISFKNLSANFEILKIWLELKIKLTWSLSDCSLHILRIIPTLISSKINLASFWEKIGDSFVGSFAKMQGLKSAPDVESSETIRRFKNSISLRSS